MESVILLLILYVLWDMLKRMEVEANLKEFKQKVYDVVDYDYTIEDDDKDMISSIRRMDGTDKRDIKLYRTGYYQAISDLGYYIKTDKDLEDAIKTHKRL